MASSILGEPRATADVDLVADLRGRHVSALFAALVDTYYIDEDATKAIRGFRFLTEKPVLVLLNVG